MAVPQHRITEAHASRAIALRAQGETWQAIADDLGVSRQGLYEWRKRERFDDELAAMQADAVDSARLRLGQLAVKATDVIGALLSADTEPRCRLAAAKEVLRLVFNDQKAGRPGASSGSAPDVVAEFINPFCEVPQQSPGDRRAAASFETGRQ